MTLLSTFVGLEIVGYAHKVPEACAAFDRLRPDVAIIDLQLPGGTGIDVLRHVKEHRPATTAIILTNYPYQQYRQRCQQAGADFFLDKALEFEQLSSILKDLLQTFARVPGSGRDYKALRGGEALPSQAVLPANEAERLEALYQAEILERPSDTSLDELVRLTADICNSPIAFLSIIEREQQSMVSTVGWEVSTIARETALCAHAILAPELFIVSDTLADERFATNPLVTGAPYLRFYASMPLWTDSGYGLGTLGVADHTPREFGRVQAETLRVLSRQVLQHILLRQQAVHLSRIEASRTGARDAFIARETSYRMLVEHAFDLMCELDQDGRYTYVTPSYYDLLGYTPEDLLGQSAFSFIHPNDVPTVLETVRHPSGQGRVTFRSRHKNGHWCWLESTGKVYQTPQGERRSVVVSRDVGEQRRATVMLHSLSQQLLEAQERERRHIAGELHDEIGQNLSLIKLNLDRVHDYLDLLEPLDQSDPEDQKNQKDQTATQTAATRLANSLDLVTHTLCQVRHLSLDLRPALLDEAGLEPALEWYVERQIELSGLSIQLSVEPLASRPQPIVETACFRVIQEALTNVIRYAQAQQVQITLRQEQDALQVCVQDDGVGFDVSAALEQAAAGKSLGLLGMQERVQLAGGQLEIVSTPDHGTIVQAYFPICQTPQVGATMEGLDHETHSNGTGR